MPHLLEQISKAAEEQWPKALFGLAVPAVQFSWKTWHDRQAVTRVAALRSKLADLAAFLQAQLGSSPSAEAVRRNAQQEYDAALAELASLCQAPQPQPPQTQQSKSTSTSFRADETGSWRIEELKPVAAPSSLPANRLRRIFLLYTPRSIKGWIAHSLYYIFLALTLIVMGAVLANIRDPEAIFAAFGGSFYGIIAFALWRWAMRIADPRRRAASPKRSWIPTTLIWIGGICLVSLVIGIGMDKQGQFTLSEFRDDLGVASPVAQHFSLP